MKSKLPSHIINAINAVHIRIDTSEFETTLRSLGTSLSNLTSVAYGLDSYVNTKDLQWIASREQSIQQGIDTYVEAISKFVSLKSKVPYDDVYQELEKQKQSILEGKPIYDTVQYLLTLKNIPSTGHCIIPHEAFTYPVKTIHRLWVAYPEFKYGDVPEHRRNAFLEDKGHDWNLSSRGISYSGILRNYGEDGKGSGRLLIEYKVKRA
tara:strand:+ start:16652 stop:17275 length:624 start_codon:yes stop_codon:yes gene_type:complete